MVTKSVDLQSLSDGSTDTGMRVDDLDRGIIALLQPDGRMPFSELASQLGVSEGTIRQRYRRMVDAGVLQVVAVADPFKIGFSTMAMIGISAALGEGRGIEDIARELIAFPEVSYAVMSTGPFDLIVEVITASHDEFVRFLTDKLHPTKGIARSETFMLLRVYKMSLGGWRMAQLRDSSGKMRDI